MPENDIALRKVSGGTARLRTLRGSLPPALVVPILKSQGGSASALRRPCLPLSAVTISLHYLPRCLRTKVTCGKTPNIMTWSEHYKICCHVIVTQWRPTVKKSARKFDNLPPQAKGRIWVSCNLTTAWHQNSEPGSCAVWVSYHKINCHCKK